MHIETRKALEERIANAGFGNFIKRFFPQTKVQKITIATAQHTCPNRHPQTGRIGCTYCNNRAFTPDFEAKTLPIRQQLERGIAFFQHKYPTMKYLAYFQSYTSTYGSYHKLVEQYEAALSHPDVVGLVVSTRPDMMPAILLDYLASLHQKKFVLIEYGVESTIDRTLEEVNRGHTYRQAVETIMRTAQKGIPIGVHLILGLPGESWEEMLLHADRLSELPIAILKLHQLQIIKGTPLAEEYLADPTKFKLFTPEEYAQICLQFLLRLRSDIALDRFLSQSPPELLLAPSWHIKNYQFGSILQEQLSKIASHTMY